MKIGIDCSLLAGNLTGVGRYTDSLVHALSRVDQENEYVLYFNARDANVPDAGNFRVAFNSLPVTPVFFRGLWFLTLPSLLKDLMVGGVDVLHSTSFRAPRLGRKKRLVVSVYDLTVISHPECHTRRNIHFTRKGLEDARERADAFIAISEHTKRDLVEFMKCPEELVTVTQLAADPSCHPVSDPAERRRVREKYGLPESYVLFIGSLEPRKNVKSLIRAYSILPERIQREHVLVIAGARGWKNSEIRKTVGELGLEKRVLFVGFIDSADLSAVYSMATVFAYPSLYEGFGLPILEAMACGTPVITSNTSSMPEVAGLAAELVTPSDTEELAAVLEHVLEDGTVRQVMREKGLRRSAEFTWERCASETLGVYQRVCQAGKWGALKS